VPPVWEKVVADEAELLSAIPIRETPKRPEMPVRPRKETNAMAHATNSPQTQCDPGNCATELDRRSMPRAHGRSSDGCLSWNGVLPGTMLLAAICAGGYGLGNAQAPTTVPNSGDFSISVSPESLALETGAREVLTVSVAAVGKFKSSVKIDVSGLPPGVTASPEAFSLTPGGQRQVIFKLEQPVQPEEDVLTLAGTSGSLSHSTQVPLSLILPGETAHAPIRTRYLRTNSYYDAYNLQFEPPHFTVYDAALKEFFISNPYMNEIDVFDAVREIQVASIPVPGAWGMDISPLTGNLYAGTLTGDLYEIDPRSLRIIQRYPSASIGPKGYFATTALVFSDGRLALQGGDGAPAVWNPATNALDPGLYDSGSVCPYGEGGSIALSGDRKLLLSVSSGTASSICSYNPATRIATYGELPGAEEIGKIYPTSDGKRFILVGPTAYSSSQPVFAVFDARTVKLLEQIPAPSVGPEQSYYSVGTMSPDGSTLYMVSGDLVAAFDTTKFALKGWIPAFLVDDDQDTVVIGAMDETGLMAGATGHGVGFIDGSHLQANQTATIEPAWPDIASGPLSGGIEINTFATVFAAGDAEFSRVYVGNTPGTGVSYTGNQGAVQVTTPASKLAGPVDLTVLMSDGAIGIAPEGFSYGPSILEVVPNGATADGGQTGTIIGYGFANPDSGISVSIGGKSAPVTQVYGYPPYVPYPFPVTVVQYTIPRGTAGETVDVTVKTDAGSTTAKGAFRYTAAVEPFPQADPLQAGIYDQRRELYFFTGQRQIEVFSKNHGRWLAPIPLPGVTSATQLLAISESPDGTKLAVSDYGGQAIYVLDPDHPASAKRFPMPQILIKLGTLTPSGLAITNQGAVYFEAPDPSGPPASGFHKLDTTTGVTTDLGIADSAGGDDKYARVLLSPDGSRVYVNIDGGTEWADTSDDQIHFPPSFSAIGGYYPELSLSNDGSTLDVDGDFADPSLHPETVPEYVEWETWLPTFMNGQKLNRDGSILFEPLTDGIDLIARNTGRLLYRIQIPEAPAVVFDPFVLTPGQNNLAIITATGISFVNLASLPIPALYTAGFPGATEAASGISNGDETAAPAKRYVAPRPADWNATPKLRRNARPVE